MKEDGSDDKMNLRLFAFRNGDFKTIHLPREEYAIMIQEININLAEKEKRKLFQGRLMG